MCTFAHRHTLTSDYAEKFLIGISARNLTATFRVPLGARRARGVDLTRPGEEEIPGTHRAREEIPVDIRKKKNPMCSDSPPALEPQDPA